ncbi:hypothetical protein INT43_003131 [Umbelopsis isabellina]|uniref:DSBA-like thioredoxin domain-containing protein n=1 Tax=Mortierella isabellina TaxID=91625 RepID=A0A8H7PP91_MORIS|nr:hypothetical protein INT43_003131 [Umbelopsis isabellina]
MQYSRPFIRKMSSTIKIDIVSDTICPWCFVGKRRLEKAIKNYQTVNPGAKFDINWYPFELDPTLTREPVSKVERYASKFGAARSKQIIEHMKSIGKEEGINFDYGGVTASTIDSHRLVEWAKEQGKQDEVIEELFKLYFEETGNIGDLEQLAGVAERIGLSKENALEYLKSDKGVKSVKEKIYKSQVEGINGVPNFTIQDKYTFSGAQPPEAFFNVFQKAASG